MWHPEFLVFFCRSRKNLPDAHVTLPISKTCKPIFSSYRPQCPILHFSFVQYRTLAARPLCSSKTCLRNFFSPTSNQMMRFVHFLHPIFSSGMGHDFTFRINLGTATPERVEFMSKFHEYRPVFPPAAASERTLRRRTYSISLCYVLCVPPSKRSSNLFKLTGPVRISRLSHFICVLLVSLC